MNKIKVFLLSLTLAVIFMPTSASAQMQSFNAAYGSTSLVRTLEGPYATRLQPLKVMPFNDEIITLAHDYQQNLPIPPVDLANETQISFQPTSSAFLWTHNDLSGTVDMVYLHGYKITDFDIDGSMIYFCGKDINTGRYFVAYIDIPTLFNAGTLTIPRFDINFPDGLQNLTKIKHYTNAIGEDKLGIISYDNNPGSYAYRFIDYNINSPVLGCNDCFETYQNNVPLLDILVTDNRVAVLGKRSPMQMWLFSHDRQDIHTYQGQMYITSIMNTQYLDSGYHATVLRPVTDDIAFGFSTTGHTYFGVINLNSMQNTNLHAISDAEDHASKLIDLEYNMHTNQVYALFCNGASPAEDNIIELNPYSLSTYTATSIRSTIILQDGYNLLSDLTLYDNDRYYTTAGRDMDGSMCWFDKKNYYYGQSRCNNVRYWKLDTEPALHHTPVQYVDQIPLIYAVQNTIDIYHMTYNYGINCRGN